MTSQMSDYSVQLYPTSINRKKNILTVFQINRIKYFLVKNLPCGADRSPVFLLLLYENQSSNYTVAIAPRQS